MRAPTKVLTNFFCVGLPRSRSAFLATLFTWDDSLCYHDALWHDPAIGRLAQLLRDAPCVYGAARGHSDASNIIAWRELSETFPNAKWIVVRRDFDECLRSCQKAHPAVSRNGLLKMQDELEELTIALNPMVVQFDEITPDKCYQMAEYLGIDIGPYVRVRQLCDMNIQIHPPILQQRLAALIKEAA